MDVSEILTVLNNHGFEDTDNTQKMEAMNDAYYDVCAREEWPFLETESNISIDVAGNCTEPTGLSKVISIRIPSIPRKLNPERYENIITYDPALSQTGDPSCYYFLGNELKFWPKPTATTSATIVYSRFPTELTTSSLETDILIPVRHQRILVTGTLFKLYLMEDDAELAGQFERHFENRIERMRADLHTRQIDRPEYILDVTPEDYDPFGYNGA